MSLSKEEKEKRRQDRRKTKWDKEHKIIKNRIYKYCTICKEFILMDDEHFYKNDKNTLDGYSSRCKECEKVRAKIHKQENREHYAILDHNWKMENKDHVRKYNQEYKEKFPEKKKAALERFFINNPEKMKEYTKNHREHDISTKEWNDTLNVFEHKCIYCGISEEEAKEKYGQKLHKDHADPKGYNDIRNAVPACRGCNDSKWKTELEKWFREQEFFTEENLQKIYWWMNEGYKDYIENKPPYRITRCRVNNDDGSWNFYHQLWTVDEKRNLVECLEMEKKKSDIVKIINTKYKNMEYLEVI